MTDPTEYRLSTRYRLYSVSDRVLAPFRGRTQYSVAVKTRLTEYRFFDRRTR